MEAFVCLWVVKYIHAEFPDVVLSTDAVVTPANSGSKLTYQQRDILFFLERKKEIKAHVNAQSDTASRDCAIYFDFADELEEETVEATNVSEQQEQQQTAYRFDFDPVPLPPPNNVYAA
jgi:hypothetical protein